MDASPARIGRYGRAAARWARLLAGGRARPGLRVFYGWDRIPEAGEPVAGGTAKLQKLAARWPNAPAEFSLLYLGTTYLPRDLRQLLWLARRRGAKVVVNQDGVAYPGWAGDRTDELNAPLRRALHAADHVLYQSEFSRRSSDLFLGAPDAPWEILPNAVDVETFTPGPVPPDGPVVLLGGDQTQEYRLELALETFRHVLDANPAARLLVGGRLVSDPAPTIARLGLAPSVELVGRYTQREAPDVYRRAHVLLHTKVNDPCPTAVIEAMACGVPVAYPASGGTVELVGDEAGVGVPHPDGFERDEPPAPGALAAAISAVLADRDRFAVGARSRAVERFALPDWLERHAELFASLLG
ncbi:glycosyltransferase family 4 protein [Gaiella sp.]|jgi:glycosyltransferase involved in cell wall biosynthesis|uniref:glycosyltransferase family 4 protein n=1 Tax=Gaiella sp. TaxID=2663207 RepID=UPI002E34A47F|nr:glycosyltransferase family 4 protein [Gaiella sp.]HEX5582102.1 glycosyltransferase family 4 protein [Gaiella sp.]